jgi:PIN domain nuclease of toxin-antitoxin system
MIFLDTHAAVWLYADPGLIPKSALALIEAESSALSPLAALEIQHLFEIGRIKADSRTIVSYLEERIGLKIESGRFADAVLASRDESWTRDPFDRVIAAHARLLQAILLSKDRNIAAAYEKTRWEDSAQLLGG